MWDELDLELMVIDVAMHERPTRITEMSTPTTDPGVYLVFYVGPLTTYQAVGDGRFPVYAGSAKSLSSRWRRHRKNCLPVRNLDGGAALWLIAVPLGSYAAALYAERLLIDRLRPLWNEPWLGGFGSRFPGETRRSQAPPPWLLMHPGRRMTEGRSSVSTKLLGRRMREHLAATVLPLWS